MVPQSIGSLHIATQLADRDFVSELTRALDVYGVEVVSSAAAAADYSVVIVDFRQNRFIGTLNASGRVAEYQLNEDVDFLIANASGTPLTNLFTASVERNYEIEERDLLSSENEERLIKQEMRQEIVRQILNRLKVLPNQNDADKASEAIQLEALEPIEQLSDENTRRATSGSNQKTAVAGLCDQRRRSAFNPGSSPTVFAAAHEPRALPSAIFSMPKATSTGTKYSTNPMHCHCSLTKKFSKFESPTASPATKVRQL